MSRPKRIGITLGDPVGVGPEVVEAALASIAPTEGIHFEIVGSAAGHEPGKPTPASARAALDALEEASRRLNAGVWDAVVTGPVCKHAMKACGFEFPGQTEFFAARSGTQDFAMCLTGGALTVALVTAHVPLSKVAGAITTVEVVRVGRLLREFLLRRGVVNPRIAVAGLNPHAGESGDLGTEEGEIIAPAVEELCGIGRFEGPLSPDTVFHQAVEGRYDGVLCMYHDQGLIPLKLHAFHEGVNVTLGLPYVRTSPDHGTAFDLAGRGVARPDSMRAALALAVSLA
jgi:4-hydroxythreonine-4-phosphate dehydrogenase